MGERESAAQSTIEQSAECPAGPGHVGAATLDVPRCDDDLGLRACRPDRLEKARVVRAVRIERQHILARGLLEAAAKGSSVR